jgi:uncharacterized membrane protein
MAWMLFGMAVMILASADWRAMTAFDRFMLLVGSGITFWSFGRMQ